MLLSGRNFLKPVRYCKSHKGRYRKILWSLILRWRWIRVIRGVTMYSVIESNPFLGSPELRYHKHGLLRSTIHSRYRYYHIRQFPPEFWPILSPSTVASKNTNIQSVYKSILRNTSNLYIETCRVELTRPPKCAGIKRRNGFAQLATLCSSLCSIQRPASGQSTTCCLLAIVLRVCTTLKESIAANVRSARPGESDGRRMLRSSVRKRLRNSLREKRKRTVRGMPRNSAREKRPSEPWSLFLERRGE